MPQDNHRHSTGHTDMSWCKNILTSRQFILLLSIFLAMTSKCSTEMNLSCLPKQIHIAYGDTTQDITVVWSTAQNCVPVVFYDTDPWAFKLSAPGTTLNATEFMAQGLHFMHRVKLTGLLPDRTYFYRAKTNDTASESLYFKTPPDGTTWEPRFLLYGDLGIHTEYIPALTSEAFGGQYTAILHAGDFGCNLEDFGDMLPENTTAEEQSSIGDAFMRMTADMASHVPYMVTPGDHGIDADTFNHYRYRFSMPGTIWPIPVDKMWYSIDIGLVHFISYSTEVFFTANGEHIAAQKGWLEADLEKANQDRHLRPWIVTYGHRPMYCSNSGGDDCSKANSLVRLGLETIFYKYGVDLVLQANDHSYERLWPMYNGKVLSEDYNNPKAPVQIITGTTGSSNEIYQMDAPAGNWSAFRLTNESRNSYGRLNVHNSSCLLWQQVSLSDKSLLDEIYINQETHGMFDAAIIEIVTETPPPPKTVVISHSHSHSNTGGTNNVPSDQGSGGVVIEKTPGTNFTALIIGLSSFGGAMLLLISGVLIKKFACKRRPGRRWYSVDYGRSFYSQMKNMDSEYAGDEVETSESAPNVKLLPDSNGR